ncbi:MAG: hypothetical protein JST54_12520 [Deltaproteobacteria bacterium]|nr:hypothetical protein [Deltaproteobacteria bacterium]
MRAPRAGDAFSLASAMRPEDAAEVRVQGRELLAAVEDSLRLSELSFAVEAGGELLALGGVAPGPAATALGPREYDLVWLLTTNAVPRHKGAFWRESLRVVTGLLRAYPVLLAHVDARYDAALRWAERLGGLVCPAVPWGASGELFHPVVWRA